MANRLDGTASFRFPDQDGPEYRLTLNNRVLMEAEDVLGYSALDACEEAKAALAMGRNPMLRTVVALFYGALVQNHREVTEDTAIDMFLSTESTAAQDAFKAVLTGTDAPVDRGVGGNAAPAKAPPAAPKPNPGAGKGSSRAGAKRGSPKANS